MTVFLNTGTEFLIVLIYRVVIYRVVIYRVVIYSVVIYRVVIYSVIYRVRLIKTNQILMMVAAEYPACK